MNSPIDWHAQFIHQTTWTASLRHYLFQKMGLPPAARILEVGCGTGALMAQIQSEFKQPLHGLDHSAERLQECRQHTASPYIVRGDATRLPYAPQSFDLTYTHFALIWINDPLEALREMRRITRPGGYVLALAEPDYAARIDYPDAYRGLGAAQREVLRQKGANPDIGRTLPDLFYQAGLHLSESGLLGAQWPSPPDHYAWKREWDLIRHDMAGRMSAQTLDQLARQDWEDRLHGRRILFVPVFYALGQV